MEKLFYPDKLEMNGVGDGIRSLNLSLARNITKNGRKPNTSLNSGTTL